MFLQGSDSEPYLSNLMGHSGVRKLESWGRFLGMFLVFLGEVWDCILDGALHLSPGCWVKPAFPKVLQRCCIGWNGLKIHSSIWIISKCRVDDFVQEEWKNFRSVSEWRNIQHDKWYKNTDKSELPICCQILTVILIICCYLKLLWNAAMRICNETFE